MLTRRIIPCLDVASGKVIRGVKFSADRVVGDPVELAAEYNRQGADELVFYDITASAEDRGLIMDVLWNAEREFYEIVTHGGRNRTGMEALEWAHKGVELGAGELVVNSIDADGTRDGYELKLTRSIVDAVSVPVVASGGAGNLEHMYRVLVDAGADAALAASIFHFGDYTVADAKHYLADRGVAVRTPT